MFCSNCGKSLPDDALFCDGCGTKTEAPAAAAPAAPQAPVYSAPQAAPQTPVYAAPQAPKKKLGKKGLIAIISSAVALVAIVITIIATSGSSVGAKSPEKVAEKFAVAYSTGDAEALVECIPDFMVNYVCQQRYIYPADRDRLAAVMQGQFSYDDYERISVLSVVRDYSEDVSDFREDLMDDYGATMSDIVSIKDICAMKVTAVIDGDVEDVYVYCIKLKNKWYAIDID